MTGAAYVSRAGLKLEHALTQFDVAVDGLDAADFGCNVGGFTDCLLRRGAARVYAVDTGYGTLAWTLRQDERVVVMERTNALHAEPPDGGVDLVVIDLGWTQQRRAVPAARGWLRDAGRIISLIKPHYELTEDERSQWLHDGRLDAARAEEVMERVWHEFPTLGATPIARVQSPITGAKSSRGGKGNVEFLVELAIERV